MPYAPSSTQGSRFNRLSTIRYQASFSTVNPYTFTDYVQLPYPVFDVLSDRIMPRGVPEHILSDLEGCTLVAGLWPYVAENDVGTSETVLTTEQAYHD
jgi:hypothetical protein